MADGLMKGVPLPQYNAHALRSFWILSPSIFLWMIGAYSQFTGSGAFSRTIEALGTVPPRGSLVALLFLVLPVAAVVLGTMGRMQASRRNQRGDSLGFLVVGLGLILLPLGFLFLSAGGRVTLP